MAHEMERAGLRFQCEHVETPGGLFRALRHGRWDLIVCVPDLSQLKLRISLALILDSGLGLPVVVVGEGSDTDVEGGEERVLAEKGVFICGRADVSRAVRQVMREIALRRELQQLLEIREGHRELLDHLPDSAYVHDAHGRFTYVNRAAERLGGYRPGELIGRNFAELVAPEYLEIARRGRNPDLGPDEPTVYELEMVAKAGGYVRVEVSSWLMLREGVATGAFGFARPVRESVAALIDEGAVRSPDCVTRSTPSIARACAWPK